MREAVLDGEIVAFDDAGRPSFERLQRRMHVTAPTAVRRLAASTPVVYAIFDLLYLDGHSLIELPYARAPGARSRSSSWAARRGGCRPPTPATGTRLLEATERPGAGGHRRQAARLALRARPADRRLAEDQAHAAPGARDRRLDPGRGSPHRADRRAADGLLPRRRRFVYAGRVGTGFTERTLDELAGAWRRCAGRRARSTLAPKLPRNAVFVEPELVAEIEFREWTPEGVMRAPSYKGLRDDKSAAARSSRGEQRADGEA